jgi:predicted GTPase
MTGPVLHRTSVEAGRGKSILQAPLAMLQRPARVVIAGECNSGKTWLTNALLGAQVLPTSFVTRTALPTVVESGPKARLVLERHDRSRVATSWEEVEAGACEGRRLCVRLPSARLKGLRLIDTPGLGDGDEAMSRRVRSICRTADVVVWCTSALQAWKGSELAFWLSLPASVRDKGVLVLTFADMLRHDQDVTRVLARLQAEAALYFQEMVTAAQLPDLLAQARPERAACAIQQPAIELPSLMPALLGA